MLKKSKILVATLLVVLVSFSSFAVALAYDGGDDNDTANIMPMNDTGILPLTKNFRMPQGTLVPGVEFIFDTELVSVDGITDSSKFTNPPNLGSFTIDYTTETGTQVPSAGIRTETKSIANIFAGVTFPHAGEFIFDIWERSPTNPTIDNDPNQILVYSNYVYRIQVLVRNDSSPSGSSIAHIYMIKGIKDENGDVVFDKSVKATTLEFTNDFVRTNGPKDPEEPDPENESTLFISKTVTGESGRKDVFFNFNISVTVPNLVPSDLIPEFYRAFIVDNDEVVLNIDENVGSGKQGTFNNMPYLEIAANGSTEFNLRHGQKLVFVDTPVGTNYTVTETEVDGYTTNIKVMTNSSSIEILGMPTTGSQFVGEPDNSAAFTNDRPFTAPMGLAINDLPFVVLIFLAIGAFVTFVVAKVRKQRKHV
ncbi:MAG: hypothetical protein FWD05_09795 [Oscillospiraceae bacterium]|nr:hypothetical protein [Oscillospiraceae bacterium]